MSRSVVYNPWSRILGVGLVGAVVGAVACEDRGEIIARYREPTAAGAGGETSDAGGAAGAAGEGPRRPVFEAPTAVDELNDPDAKDQDPSLTADLLEILFFSDRGGDEDLWTSTRATRDAPWQPPTAVVELNSDSPEQSPAISRDGLRLWFYSRREPPGIWYSERASRSEPWSEPVAIPIDVQEPEGVVIAPALDELELRMAVSVGTGTSRDIYETVRASWEAPWGEPVSVAGLNVGTTDSTPFLIDDGSELLFSSGRAGEGDLFWAHRLTPAQPVDLIEPLTELNDEDMFESHPHLAADRSVVFFGSDRSGNTDIYQARAR